MLYYLIFQNRNLFLDPKRIFHPNKLTPYILKPINPSTYKSITCVSRDPSIIFSFIVFFKKINNFNSLFIPLKLFIQLTINSSIFPAVDSPQSYYLYRKSSSPASLNPTPQKIFRYRVYIQDTALYTIIFLKSKNSSKTQ